MVSDCFVLTIREIFCDFVQYTYGVREKSPFEENTEQKPQQI